MCVGEGNGTPLQYSCLENPMDRGAWWATVHGVAKSQARLSDFPFTFHFHALEKEMATHSSVLAWRIPGTAEPGGLPSMGLHSRTWLKRLSSSSSSYVFLLYSKVNQLYAYIPFLLSLPQLTSPSPWDSLNWFLCGYFCASLAFLCGLQQCQPKICVCVCEVAQLRLTLCDPMDSSLPGSSAHGIFQAIVLEWIAISFFSQKW